MRPNRVASIALSLLAVLSCATFGPTLAFTASGAPLNPPAPGFDLEYSDPAAITIADATMAAMGGRAAWDRTHFVRWNFFGRRTHLWDKWSGDLRTELIDEDGRRIVMIMNLHTKQGRAWIGPDEVEDATELQRMLDRTEAMWINDGYWVFMPYKLKDSGVTLRLLGEKKMEDGRAADVLELTFAGVGRTPENKYDVYVARDTHLVEQWSYYGKAEQAEPDFTTPWHGWERYGEILLSSDRGEGRSISDIAVFDRIDPALFAGP